MQTGAALLSCALMLGCGDDPPISSGPGDYRAGNYPSNVGTEAYTELRDLPGQYGKVRGYKLHIPGTYDPQKPMPLVFAFHGRNQTAVLFGVNGTDWVKKSDEAEFVLVLPNGIAEDRIGGSWNAGTCCGNASTQHIDDVGFVRAIFEDVKKHVNVDFRRVFATGYDSGAFMSYRLACEAADIFAAIAPLAGAIGTVELSGSVGSNQTPDLTKCAPTQPVSVLAIHGTADKIVPYSVFKPSLDFFAKKNACKSEFKAAAIPASAGDTSCVSYEGCALGGDLTACTVQGGGHCWFGVSSCGTGLPGIGNLTVGQDSDTLSSTDAAWAFFAAHGRIPTPPK